MKMSPLLLYNSLLPWDDVRGLVDATVWVMGDNEVLHPRRIDLLIQAEKSHQRSWISGLLLPLLPSVT